MNKPFPSFFFNFNSMGRCKVHCCRVPALFFLSPSIRNKLMSTLIAKEKEISVLEEEPVPVPPFPPQILYGRIPRMRNWRLICWTMERHFHFGVFWITTILPPDPLLREHTASIFCLEDGDIKLFLSSGTYLSDHVSQTSELFSPITTSIWYFVRAQ